MNIRDAIIARINSGPADRIDLHGSVMRQCNLREAAAPGIWSLLTTHCAELVAAGKIRQDVTGCYTLPTGARMEEKTDDKPVAKLRAGTVVPKQYRHLVGE